MPLRHSNSGPSQAGPLTPELGAPRRINAASACNPAMLVSCQPCPVRSLDRSPGTRSLGWIEVQWPAATGPLHTEGTTLAQEHNPMLGSCNVYHPPSYHPCPAPSTVPLAPLLPSTGSATRCTPPFTLGSSPTPPSRPTGSPVQPAPQKTDAWELTGSEMSEVIRGLGERYCPPRAPVTTGDPWAWGASDGAPTEHSQDTIGGGRERSGPSSHGVDEWELGESELTKALSVGGTPHRNTEVFAHHLPRHTAAQLRRRSNPHTPTDMMVFCDNSHYRAMFREGSRWHLFDSMGLYGPLERDVWPVFQGHDSVYTLHRIHFNPQSDHVNCGVWVLWAVGTWVKYLREEPSGFANFPDYLLQEAATSRIRDLGHINAAHHTNTLATLNSNLDFIHTMKLHLRSTTIPRSTNPRSRVNPPPPPKCRRRGLSHRPLLGFGRGRHRPPLPHPTPYSPPDTTSPPPAGANHFAPRPPPCTTPPPPAGPPHQAPEVPQT